MKVGTLLAKAELLTAIDHIPRHPDMNLEDPAIAFGLDAKTVNGRKFFLQSSTIISQHVKRSVMKELKGVFMKNGLIDFSDDVHGADILKMEEALNIALAGIMAKVYADTHNVSKSVIAAHLGALKSKYRISPGEDEFRFDGYTEAALHHSLVTLHKRFQDFFSKIRWSEVCDTDPAVSAELSAE